jgi:PAS domain S-box-containing protein
MRHPDFEIDYLSGLIDTLEMPLAVIDYEGFIVKTNKAWETFEHKPEVTLCGGNAETNYLERCRDAIEMGDDPSLKALLGIKKVMDGRKQGFSITYSCKHNQAELWFEMKVKTIGEEKKYLLITHRNITRAERARQKTEQSAQRYRMQFEHNLEGTLITSTEGHIIDANPAACTMLGYTKQELLKRSREEVMDVNDTVYRQALHQREQTGSYRVEMHMKHAGGHTIPVEVLSRSYEDEDGSLRATVNFKNISERKAVQEKLKNQKEFSDLVINSIPGLFYVLDADGRIIRCNDALLDILGYTHGEITAMDTSALIPDEAKPHIQGSLRKAFREGKASVNSRLRAKNGTIYNFQFTAHRFEDQGQSFLAGTGIDITRQKSAEQQKRKHQLLMEQLFDNAPIGIAMVDTEHTILDVNQSFEQIFGYTPAEAVGESIDRLIAANPDQRHANAISKEAFKGKSFQIETIRQTKTDKEVPVLIGSVPVELDGDVIAIYGMYVDMSKQDEYRKQIEEALNEKTALLSEIHHRVKNNLALITGLIELQVFDTTDEELHEKLNATRKRVQTIASVHEAFYKTDNFNEMPFHEYGRELAQQSITLNEVEEKNISLSVNFDEMSLSINKALPAGLFLNELLGLIYSGVELSDELALKINCEQHEECVYIGIKSPQMGKYMGGIKDSESLSLTLIRTLLKQLDADIVWPGEDTDQNKIEVTFAKEPVQGFSSSLFGGLNQ